MKDHTVEYVSIQEPGKVIDSTKEPLIKSGRSSGVVPHVQNSRVSRAIAKVYNNEAGHNGRKNRVHDLIRSSLSLRHENTGSLTNTYDLTGRFETPSIMVPETSIQSNFSGKTQ